MTLACEKILIGNTVRVQLVGIEAEIENEDGELVMTPLVDDSDDYTVACVAQVLLAETRAAVSGGDSLEMEYTGTPGRWRCVIPHTLTAGLTPDVRYIVRAVATVDAIGVGDWEVERVAQRRAGSQRC